jgi:hypothetical protein
MVRASGDRQLVPSRSGLPNATGSELEANRPLAAASLAIHGAINAADAVTGQRVGRRTAGQDHAQVRLLLREAGKDGAARDKDLARYYR